MATSRLFLLVLAVVAAPLAGCATSKSAASPSGDASLALADPEGKTTTLDALRAGTDATVLVFWSGTCPCVRRYQQRVDALLDTYPADRVQVIGVSSNAGETYAEALRVAKERQVRIPILRDEGGAVARAIGATSTPTVAVLDRAGAVRFVGWVDNERLPGDAGREPWLDRAIQGVLDGKTRFSAKSPVYGCTITRSLFNPAQSSCCSAH